ncbi:hypothetical protein HanRHA438_Chr17g0819521 [Helianthus annuus]|nr:hypothetical protein HanOQP8_Chr17g0665351 [Helianthus annuus]KAJ0826899.1 hypothetical protein HanRHA438_Chr17g0819521 [Helianthus annuus]
MCLSTRAVSAGTFIGYNNRHGPAGTNRFIQTLHFVTGPTPFTTLKQNRTHCSHTRPKRFHIHQRSVPTRATCASRISFLHTQNYQFIFFTYIILFLFFN